MELSCAFQCYAWGKIGEDSQVARYGPRACKDFQLDAASPYAELWMGTHTNGPAKLVHEDKLLSQYIAENKEALGAKIQAKFGNELPFLFKVLSVNKALSIQAHPNKSHAEQLHAERPNVYKDPNHKPEIAIALTKFEGLCGFRPLEEIQNFISTIPELKSVLKSSDDFLGATKDTYQESLKHCFEELMVCDKDLLTEKLESLRAKLSAHPTKDSTSALFLKTHDQYPGDVGCFVIYFLNHLSLEPGQAMFLGPNVPHAYLSGDCVEVMANSDNVVRAGLTPKLIDTPTLVSMLDYTCTPAQLRYFTPTQTSESCQEFDPPVPDFSVARYEVPGESESYKVTVRDTASIILVTEGCGKYLASSQITRQEGVTVVEPFASADIYPGSVLFLPADKIIEVFPENCSKLVIFQAFCNL